MKTKDRKPYAMFAGFLVLAAYFWRCVTLPGEFHFIDSANLVFHEAGHTIFSFFGFFVKIAAGSGFQVALPLAIAIYFFAKGQKISGAACLLWTGESLSNVSVYAADAVRMELPLLGGDSVIHDWNYLLGATGLLGHTDAIASGMHVLALILVALGTVLGAYFCFRKNL